MGYSFTVRVLLLQETTMNNPTGVHLFFHFSHSIFTSFYLISFYSCRECVGEDFEIGLHLF